MMCTESVSKGVLMDPSGDLVIKPCLQAELDFYAQTAANHPEFANVIPTYMGDLNLDLSRHMPAHTDREHEELQEKTPIQTSPDEVQQATAILAMAKPLDTPTAVVLENIAAGFVHPNIVDLKLGTRLWADDYTEEKREKREKASAQTTSGQLGFRVTGMKIWKSKSYVLYNRYYGRALTADTVHEALEELVCLGTDKESVRDTIRGIIGAIENIEHIIANQESRIYASSLLLVYEGDQEARRSAIKVAYADAGKPLDSHGSSANNNGTTKSANLAQLVNGDAHPHDETTDSDDESVEGAPKDKVFDARIIDFGHAKWTPGEGPDENMLHGIRNLLGVFRRIEDKAHAT